MTTKFTLLCVAAAVLLFGASASMHPVAPVNNLATVSSDPTPQTYTGTLVDAECNPTSPGKQCEVTENTKSFSLQISSDKILKFDDEGNAKVREAVQASRKTGSGVKAAITGSMDGDTLKVEAVQIM